MHYPALEKTLNRLMELDQASVLALADVAAERLRQIEGEGWSPEHDDAHNGGEMSNAGAAYAATPHTPKHSDRPPHVLWPWEAQWWKPGSKHRNCVRGAALIVAELARLSRKAPKL